MIDKSELYEKYQPKVYAYLLSSVKDRYTAEDLCGDVFLKIYSKLEYYDSTKSSLSTWIYNITKNTLYDYYRTAHTTCELYEEAEECEDLDEGLEHEDELKALANALMKLNDIERAVIVGKYYQHKTLQKLADELGISVFRVWSIHKKSTEKIKKIMQQEQKNENLFV